MCWGMQVSTASLASYVMNGFSMHLQCMHEVPIVHDDTARLWAHCTHHSHTQLAGLDGYIG